MNRTPSFFSLTAGAVLSSSLVAIGGGARPPVDRGVHAQSSVALASAIREVNPNWKLGMWPVGLNDRGQVAGNLTSRGRAFVDTGGRIVDLGIPSGYKHSDAIGISNNGAVLVKAVNGPHKYSFFVSSSGPTGRKWIRLRSGLANYRVASAARIDARGDIIGTLSREPRDSHGRDRRAAVWMATDTKGYGRATILPLQPAARGSIGSAIWNGDNRVLAAGCAIFSRPQGDDCMEMWIRSGHGHFQRVTAVGNSSEGIDAFGGWGNHVYAAGEGGGYDYSFGWVAGVRPNNTGYQPALVAGGAIGSPPRSGLFYGIASVTGDAAGRMVAVGEAQEGDLQSNTAIIWLGDSRGQNLQDLLPARSGWTLEYAMGVNRRGQILGEGKFAGHSHTFLLKVTI